MAIPWVIVGGTGYDVEDVERPQTRDMRCPACERHVRFVEKQLVKNLRVFSVPLLSVEKGRRVFACPLCSACVEPPGDGAGPPDEASLAAAESRLERARFDVDLWKRRLDLARDHNDEPLAERAKQQLEAARRELTTVRDLVSKMLRAVTGMAPEPESAPQLVQLPPAATQGPTAPSGEPSGDEPLAALRARIARREREEREASAAAATPADATAPPATSAAPASAAPVEPPHEPEPPRSPEPSEADVDAEFAALKARVASGERARDKAPLRLPVSEPEPTPTRAPEPAPPQAVAPEPAPWTRPAEPAAPPSDSDVDAELAALKARRSAQPAGTARDETAYLALKRQMAEPEPPREPVELAPSPSNAAPEPPPREPPPPRPPEPADDDPISSLKRRLKKPGA